MQRPNGVGAVLSHRLANDVEHPIIFASCTMVPAEVKYTQLDKEGLAIVFGLKKFHNYLHDKYFIVSRHTVVCRAAQEAGAQHP